MVFYFVSAVSTSFPLSLSMCLRCISRSAIAAEDVFLPCLEKTKILISFTMIVKKAGCSHSILVLCSQPVKALRLFAEKNILSISFPKTKRKKVYSPSCHIRTTLIQFIDNHELAHKVKMCMFFSSDLKLQKVIIHITAT